MNDVIKINIFNWEKYNPRKDVKATTWLRLQNNIFEDSDFFSLNHEQICIWIYLLTIASKKQNGTIFVNLTHAVKIGQFSPETLIKTIKYYEEIQLLEVDRNADVTQTLLSRYATNERTNERTICIAPSEQYEINGTSGKSPDAPSRNKFDFESLYQLYPKRQNGQMAKASGMKSLKSKIKSQKKFDQFKSAVQNYKRMVDEGLVDKQFIKMWSTFANQFEDFLPENTVRPKESPFETF